MQPEFIVFLDENHQHTSHILTPLAEAGIQVERHSDHFIAGMHDADWLPFVGRAGWILLTTDKRIRYRHLEKRQVRIHAVRMFCFTSNFAPVKMADALRKAIPRMRKIVDQQEPPFIASIAESGEVRMLDFKSSERDDAS